MITTAIPNVLSDNEMEKNATAVPEITTNQHLTKATNEPKFGRTENH
jgi:hypothetical protein